MKGAILTDTAYITSEKTKYPPFYPVPMILFEKQFTDLSTEAKILYGMLLSKADLSQKNGWNDNGKIYIYFTIKETMTKLSCGEQKASRLMLELEKHSLIARKRHGCGKPYRIFPILVFPKLVEITANSIENQG